MSICELIAAPAMGPNPGTTLSTPFGIPAFREEKPEKKMPVNSYPLLLSLKR